MRYSLLTQIVLIIISIVIIITVAKPMFTDIKNVQDEMVVYKDAVDKAQQFNARLQELIAIRDSFSVENMVRLDHLLPTEIDVPKIMRDFESIFSQKQLFLTSISTAEAQGGSVETEPVYDENGELIASGESSLSYKDFKVDFTGSYENLKDILSATELNQALLEVVSLKFGEHVKATDAPVSLGTNKDSDQFDFEIMYRVYSLAVAPTVTK